MDQQRYLHRQIISTTFALCLGIILPLLIKNITIALKEFNRTLHLMNGFHVSVYVAMACLSIYARLVTVDMPEWLTQVYLFLTQLYFLSYHLVLITQAKKVFKAKWIGPLSLIAALSPLTLLIQCFSSFAFMSTSHTATFPPYTTVKHTSLFLMTKVFVELLWYLLYWMAMHDKLLGLQENKQNRSFFYQLVTFPIMSIILSVLLSTAWLIYFKYSLDGGDIILFFLATLTVGSFNFILNIKEPATPTTVSMKDPVMSFTDVKREHLRRMSEWSINWPANGPAFMDIEKLSNSPTLLANRSLKRPSTYINGIGGLSEIPPRRPKTPEEKKVEE
jgi:hypothetical protein